MILGKKRHHYSGLLNQAFGILFPYLSKYFVSLDERFAEFRIHRNYPSVKNAISA